MEPIKLTEQEKDMRERISRAHTICAHDYSIDPSDRMACIISMSLIKNEKT